MIIRLILVASATLALPALASDVLLGNVNNLQWHGSGNNAFATWSSGAPTTYTPLIYWPLTRPMARGSDTSAYTNDFRNTTGVSLWTNTAGGSVHFNGLDQLMTTVKALQQTTSGNAAVFTWALRVKNDNATRGAYQWLAAAIDGALGANKGPFLEVTLGNTWAIDNYGVSRNDTGITVTTNLTAMCVVCNTNQVKLYIDGIVKLTINAFGMGSFNATPKFTIGKVTDYPFLGCITDVQYVGDYAATSNECYNYAQGAAFAQTKSVYAPMTTWVTNLDNLGSVTGGEGLMLPAAFGTSPTYTIDSTNSYHKFDGGDYVTNYCPLNVTTAMTYDFWVRPTAINKTAHDVVDIYSNMSHRALVTLGGNYSNSAVNFIGTIGLQRGNLGDVDYGRVETVTNAWTAADLNVWRHIKVTYDCNAAQPTRIYKDGVEMGLTRTNLTGALTGCWGVCVGADIDDLGANQFVGDLRELKIYNEVVP